ncbi:MAG: hypothetical protein CMJ64_24665, partial [Planctomycetaceae bacterium]|nr:hypothetical protein [Planctomycetaceae bacterium]
NEIPHLPQVETPKPIYSNLQNECCFIKSPETVLKFKLFQGRLAVKRSIHAFEAYTASPLLAMDPLLSTAPADSLQ